MWSALDALQELAEFGQMAARLVARGKPSYEQDEALQLAGEAIMHRIGEAVARLPEQFLADHPDVEWRKMKRMRTIVAHDYLRVDREIVWTALASRVPEVATYLAAILEG
ncbi:MAG: HepT-like ribonuclease domain-containing protein [Jatrophihabitantaceae bacterium]